MSSHALLSPSGASRWLACTPSARLEQQFPDNAGDAAREGTLAHSLGELFINWQLNRISKKDFSKAYDTLMESPFYDNSMKEYVDNYMSFVLETFAAAQAHTVDAQMFLEQKLDLTAYVPEGFGTGDVVIIADGYLDLIDLKFGKGVPVSSENNKQMMLYALGAVEKFGDLYDIQTVTMTIYQPRIDNISSWSIPLIELLGWAEAELKPRAALAFTGDGDYAPGPQCRFCRAKAVCRANADYNLDVLKYDFKAPDLLEDAEIADVLGKVDSITKWVAAIEAHALNEAVNKGKKWPGYKLVEGRSNRQLTDPAAVAKKLIAYEWSEAVIYEPKKLLGITALEKLLTKKVFENTLGGFVVKPPGKPALVPASDKRTEYSSAANAVHDFADVDIDE